MLKKYQTLNDLFVDQIEKEGYIRFINRKSEEEEISFSEFGANIKKCLGLFQDLGFKSNDEIVINTKSNIKFLECFWAAILGGMIPVPVAVGVGEEHRKKLFKVLLQLKNPKLITDADVHSRLISLLQTKDKYFSLTDIVSQSIVDIEFQKSGVIKESNSEDVAFIQYSSGSTSDPKGIVLTHKNLTTNIYAIAEGLDLRDDDVGMNWMPLTHDMGLIGTHMTLFSYGLSQIIMDTELFIRKPLLWLVKTSESRASILTSPNFGYKHLLRAHKRKKIKDIDLSCVRLLINGAESISVTLCKEFLDEMSTFQLKEESMFPVYGLAEATLGVSFPKTGEKFRYINLDRETLKNNNTCEESDDDKNSIPFVMHGKALRDCEYKIVDDAGKSLPEKINGNIKIRGANVTKEIYRDENTTNEIIDSDGWLSTGDCGAVIDNNLIITGRKKEIIIINGQNYYPNDIENIIVQGGNFDLGKIVVCGAINKNTQNDQLLVFVLYKSDLMVFKSIAEEIRRIVIQQLNLEIDHVIPIKKIPKTTSGKIQRIKLSLDYQDGVYSDYLIANQVNTNITNSDEVLKSLLEISNQYSKEFIIKEDDDLFNVGISSLTLTEIMMAIEEIYPDTIDLDTAFDNPTLKQISKIIKQNL